MENLSKKVQEALFGSNGLSSNSKLPYFETPENFPLVVQAISRAGASLPQMIQTLIEAVQKSHHNGPALMTVQSKGDEAFCRLIQLAIELAVQKSRRCSKAVLGLVKVLTQQWTPKKQHYRLINDLVKQNCLGKNSEGIKAGLKLREICSRSAEYEEKGFSYFFFSPRTTGIISEFPHSINLSKGLSVVMHLRAEDLSSLSKGSVLFRVRTASHTFELLALEFKLVYRVRSLESEYLRVDLLNLPKGQWSTLAISHGPQKQFSLILNSETKSLFLDFPHSSAPCTNFCFAEGFFGQISALAFFNIALEKAPSLGHDCIGLKSFLKTCSETPQLFFSALRTSGKIARNLGSLNAKGLLNDSGYTHYPTKEIKGKVVPLLRDLLPAFQSLKDFDSHTSQEILVKILASVQADVKNINKYANGTIRAKTEYKEFSQIFTLFCLSQHPQSLSADSLGIIEELIGQTPNMLKCMIIGIYNTKQFWWSIDLSLYSKLWELISSNFELTEQTPLRFLCEILSYMDRIGKNGECCQHQIERRKQRTATEILHLDTRYDVLLPLLEETVRRIPSKREPAECIIELLVKSSVNHCLFLRAIRLLSGLELNLKDIPLVMNAAANQGMDVQLAIARFFIQEIGIEKLNQSTLFKWIWKNTGKKLSAIHCESNKLVEENKSFTQKSDIQSFHEEPSDDNNTSLLQERVINEEANIKKIQQMMINIQESTKKGRQNDKRNEVEIDTFSFTDLQPPEKPSSSEQHILSIEELVAQDPYKPPPAPKNERMKAKRFVFGSSEESEDPPAEKKVAPKIAFPPLNIPAESQSKITFPVDKVKPAKLIKPPIKKFDLEIDTDSINKEFDIGGEKGKKLVDEEDEQMREEQEIIELAEHCVLAMSRTSPNEPVRSKYASKNIFGYGISVPITSTHKATLEKEPLKFPQSTRERKQFTFQIGNTVTHPDTQAITKPFISTPIEEESSVSSKSSAGPEMVQTILSLSSENIFTNADLEIHAIVFFNFLVGNLLEIIPARPADLRQTLSDFADKTIVHPGVLTTLIKLLRKAIGTPVLSSLIEGFCSIIKNKKENALAFETISLRNLLKFERDLFAIIRNDLGKQQNSEDFTKIIAVHSYILAEHLSTGNPQVIQILTDWIIGFGESPGAAGDIFKILWLKTLDLISSNFLKEVTPELRQNISVCADLTLFLLLQLNDLDKEHGFTLALSFPYDFSKSKEEQAGEHGELTMHISPTCQEIVKKLSEILHQILFKEIEEILSNSEVNSSVLSEFIKKGAIFAKNHLNPLLNKRKGNNVALRGSISSIASLLSILLRNAELLEDVEYWLQEYLNFFKYLLLLHELTAKSLVNPKNIIEDNIMLLIGSGLQLCLETYQPAEMIDIATQFMSKLFKFLFSIMGVPNSKTFEFYEKFLWYDGDKYIVPLEEVPFTEEVGLTEIQQILTPEYAGLFETNEFIQRSQDAFSESLCRLRGPGLDINKNEDLTSERKNTLNNIEQNWAKKNLISDSMNNLYIESITKKFGQSISDSSQIVIEHYFENGLKYYFYCKPCSNSIKPESISVSELQKEDQAQIIARELYLKMDEKIRKKVCEPINCVYHTLIQSSLGFVMIYHKKVSKSYLLFIPQSFQAVSITKWDLKDIVNLYRKNVKDQKKSPETINKSLQIEMNNGETVLLSFNSEEERNLLARKLLRLREKWCMNLHYTGSLDPHKSFNKSLISKMWFQGWISNLDYLMACYKFSALYSFSNIEAYPVVPLMLDDLYYTPINAGNGKKMDIIIAGAAMDPFKSQCLAYENKLERHCVHCSPVDTPITIAESYSNLAIFTREDSTLLIDTCSCRKSQEESRSPWTFEASLRHLIQLNEKFEQTPTEIIKFIESKFGVESGEARILSKIHPEKPALHSRCLLDCDVRLKLMPIKNLSLPSPVAICKIFKEESGAIRCLTLSEEGILTEFTIMTKTLTASIQSSKQPQINPVDKAVITPNNSVLIVSINKSDQLRYAVQGGSENGGIQLVPSSDGLRSVITLNYHSSSVSCVSVDESESIGIVGTQDGDCILYSIREEMFWRPRKTLSNHTGQITSIAISSSMRLFATASEDGRANLYTLSSNPKLVLTFLPFEGQPIKQIYLVQRPLPVFIVIVEEAISVFDLHGTKLSEAAVNNIEGITILRDSLFNYFIVYGVQDSLQALKLPLLENRILLRCPKPVSHIIPRSFPSSAVLLHTDGQCSLLHF